MKRRPRRSLPATLTALVLLAVCALVATIAIQLLTGHRAFINYQSVATTLHNTHWNNLALLIAGGVAALLGLILLLAAFLPGKLTILPLAAGDSGLNSGASRRSFGSTLRAAASTVDGVSAAKLTLRRRKVAAVVHSDRTNTAGLADAVRSAIEQRLGQITPTTDFAVKIRVRAARSAS